MYFYNSKDLSRKLGIPPARWKRWVREFLPPDPLGGLQSGYARQFNYKEAFSVYLGGSLVAGLKFTIPQARQILTELNPWLEANGFFRLHPNGGAPPEPGIEEKSFIFIDQEKSGRFRYSLYTLLHSSEEERQAGRSFLEKAAGSLTGTKTIPSIEGMAFARVICIHALYTAFLKHLS